MATWEETVLMLATVHSRRVVLTTLLTKVVVIVELVKTIATTMEAKLVETVFVINCPLATAVRLMVAATDMTLSLTLSMQVSICLAMIIRVKFLKSKKRSKINAPPLARYTRLVVLQ